MDIPRILDLQSEEAGDGLWRIRVGGDVVLGSADQLRNFVAGMIKDGHVNLVLDLGGVDYMDSSGLAVLLGALRRVREQEGSLRLVCRSKTVLRLLSLTGLDRLLPVDRDGEEAPEG